MENHTVKMTALAPTFAMPVYGPASCSVRTSAWDTAADAGQTIQAVAPLADVRVDAGHAKGLFLGLDAWSPPIS